MAGKGTYAAYQQLRPSGDGISQDIKYWNQDATAKRQEQAALDAAEQERLAKQQDKNEKRRTAFLDSMKGMENVQTGSVSLNKKVAGTILGAKEKMKEIIPLIEDPSNLSIGERIELEDKFNNLLNTPKNIAFVTDFLKQRYDGYLKAKEDGSIWEEPEFENAYQNGFEKVAFGFDENGSPLVAIRDDNNDGVIDIKDNLVSLEDLKNGVIDSDFKFQKKISTDAVAQGIASQVAESDITTDNGYRSEQIVQAKQEAVDNLAKRAIYNPDGSLADYAKSELRLMGLSGIENQKDEESQAVLNDAVAAIENKLKTAVSDYTDFKKKENITPRTSSGKPTKGPDGTLGQQAEATPEYWDGIELDTDKYWAVDLPGGAKIASLTIGGENYTNADVRTATIDKNGNLALNIVYQSFKSSKYGTPRETANKMAQLLAYKDDYEKKTNPSDAETRKYEDTKLELETITTGMENKSKSVIVPNEIQASVARQLGTTIDAIRQKATKRKDNTETEEPNIEQETTAAVGVGAKYNK